MPRIDVGSALEEVGPVVFVPRRGNDPAPGGAAPLASPARRPGASIIAEAARDRRRAPPLRGASPLAAAWRAGAAQAQSFVQQAREDRLRQAVALSRPTDDSPRRGACPARLSPADVRARPGRASAGRPSRRTAGARRPDRELARDHAAAARAAPVAVEGFWAPGWPTTGWSSSGTSCASWRSRARYGKRDMNCSDQFGPLDGDCTAHAIGRQRAAGCCSRQGLQSVRRRRLLGDRGPTCRSCNTTR